MFRVFASSGGSKTLSDDHQRAAFPGESSHGEGPIRHVRIAIVGGGSQGWGWRFDSSSAVNETLW